jgi:hypothetical protein
MQLQQLVGGAVCMWQPCSSSKPAGDGEQLILLLLWQVCCSAHQYYDQSYLAFNFLKILFRS